jgi:Skp family chaperone for outer membrane proteins
MISNRYRYGIGGVIAIAVALGAGFYVGHQGVTPAYADVATSPQTIAQADGAPSVPGLCVLSQNAVYASAKVGQAATARYRELNAQLRDQLQPQQQAIQDEAKKLETAQARMPAAEFQQKQQALAQRIQALRDANGRDSKELEATRLKAVRQIAEWSNPVIADAYKAHRCGALFSRDAMLVGNPGMDLTSIVVAGLDGKITTMTFDLDKTADVPATSKVP